MKTEIGAKNCLYPMPTTLVGAMVNGKPNYITIAHVGIMERGLISLSMGKSHHTNAGIKENGTFSVNVPSREMVKETDYCGLASGRDVDKAALFTTFYGKLGSTPMIEECPVNMECRVERTLDFPTHDVFIGQVVATYCDEAVLTDGAVDAGKVRPILFVMNDRSYWNLGGRLARAWDVGKDMKPGK